MTKLKNVLHSYAMGMVTKDIRKYARVSGNPHIIGLICLLISQKTDLK